VEFHSPWRGSEFSFVRAPKDMHISLQISPPSPASHEIPYLRVSSIQGEPQKGAFDLDLDLQPAVFLHLAHDSSTTSQSGKVTLRMARNGYWRETRLEAATGRLIELIEVKPIAGFSGSNAVVLRLYAEEGAFERMRQWIATPSAHHTNEYVANPGLSPWIHFALPDLLESPLVRHLCDRVLTERSRGDRREWAQALSRVEAGMVLARDLLAQPAFDRVLEPLNAFVTADTNSAVAAVIENDFQVPDDTSPSGDAVAP